jgi:hypothetical protein
MKANFAAAPFTPSVIIPVFIAVKNMVELRLDVKDLVLDFRCATGLYLDTLLVI